MKQLYKSLFIAFFLFASLQAHSQCSGFYDGFESGSFSPTWQPGTGSYTNTVPNTGSAVGTYNLQMNSQAANSFYQGLSAVFTPQQPTYCSWWMKTNTTNAANGYVVIGNSSIATDNGIIFCYFNASSQLRFFASTGYNYPITANTWYFVEARNMNWTTRTSDIYINNVLVIASWPFRSTTAMSVDRIHVFSITAATANYDEFIIGTPPVTATSVASGVLCNGGSNGSATVTASGGNGVYSYNWAPSGGTSATASGLSAGTYTCTITDGTGCTATHTVNITQPSAISITATATNVLCSFDINGSVDATVSGGTPGYSYNWSNGYITEDLNGVPAGNYALYVTDANGCMDTLFGIAVNQPSPITASVVSTDVSCNGDASGAISLTPNGGTPGYTFLWSPGGATVSNPSGLTAGTYTCTITDANGCTSTETATVSEPSAITLTVSAPDTVCEGSNTVLTANGSGGSGTLQYIWMPGNLSGSTVTINISSTTTGTVMISDSLGCGFTDTFTIVARIAPSVSLGNDITQCGASVTLDAGNPGMMYLWSDNSTAQTNTVTASGMYYVDVTDMNGCVGSDTINVTLNANPVVDLGADTANCGAGVVLDAQNAGSTYLWNDNSTSQTLTANASGTYYVTVTDPSGCEATDTVTVTIYSLPNVTAAASQSSACADDANITLTGTPANGTWSGTGVSGNAFDPSVGAGTYTPVYTFTDNNGCTNTASVSLTVNACVGVEESVAAGIMMVYPNPNNGQFQVQMNLAADEMLVEILAADGRKVQSMQLNAVTAGSVHAISMANESNGVYFVRVTMNGETSVQKITVLE